MGERGSGVGEVGNAGEGGRVLAAITSPARRAPPGCCRLKQRMLAAACGTAASFLRGLGEEQSSREMGTVSTGDGVAAGLAKRTSG